MKKSRYVLGLSCSVVLAGCEAVGAPTMRTSEAAINDTFAAFAFSAQQSGVIASNDRGYVVLVEPDGDTEVLETSVMQNAQLAWNDGKLAFADTENDYILGESMTIIPTEKKPD